MERQNLFYMRNKIRSAGAYCMTLMLLSLVMVIADALNGNAMAAQCGRASWYALDGRRTANGERMNSRRLTAAHRTLRFGTRVRVRNRRNGRSVVVRINDRGPFTRGRIIDVSRAAARRLGFVSRGTARVCLSR
jgi:rare lipoprotein A